jgi:Trk-type K+ transport system membrane component
MQETIDRHAYRLLFGAVLVLLGFGTVFYHYVEKFPWLDSYYFCVVTLATVGYGDYVPHTDIGKLFTTFYIFGGVGILTTFLSLTMRRRALKMQQRSEARNHNKEHKTEKS